MSLSSDALLVQYQQWFEITTFEHRTIIDRKWNELNSFTEKKHELMESIKELEKKNPTWKKEQSDTLNLLIHQLADLELLNQTLIQERLGEVKGQMKDMDRRTRIVQQLRDKYKIPGSRSMQSFSRNA